MEYKIVEKKNFKGDKVKVLAETYEPGEPETLGCGEDLGWRKNLMRREEMLKYLQNGERYFYSSEWYGSERKR